MKLSFLVSFWMVAAGALAGEQPGKPATRPSTVGTVAESAADVNPLGIGDHIPSATLETVDNKPFDLDARIAKAPTVLIFYRGGWCPFCNRQMAGLQGIVSDLKDSGYQLLAVSPDLPSQLNQSVEKHALTYTVLSDPEVKAIKAFGLAFHVNDDTYRRMLTFGVDLEKASGQQHHVLPVPAVYIIGTDGVIRFVHFDPDYRTR
jgi:peroxiredoxin